MQSPGRFKHSQVPEPYGLIVPDDPQE